ncbi:MAG: metallophosphoesterase family protein [Faecalibacillus sp.]
MKIMILSDSHSMPKNKLVQLLNRHQVDYYIHCGDVYMPFTEIDNDHFYIVRGNNDMNPIPQNLTLMIDGLKFYIVHGHLYNIDYGIQELEYYAKENNIDVICFGHTHNPFYQVKDHITYINPGSVTYPRGQYRGPTYCLFDTQNQEVTFYDVNKNDICDPFSKEEKQSFSFFSLFKKKKQ